MGRRSHPLKPTVKELAFVREYLETGNGTEAVMRAYDTNNRSLATKMAYVIKNKPAVAHILQEQAAAALMDQISIREELRESKTDYAVRARVNMDLMDRAGMKPSETRNLTQINVYSTEQAERMAERVLRAREEKGTGASD